MRHVADLPDEMQRDLMDAGVVRQAPSFGSLAPKLLLAEASPQDIKGEDPPRLHGKSTQSQKCNEDSNVTTSKSKHVTQYERDEFELYKTREMEKIEEMRAIELKRLRREKQIFEKHKQANEILPSRRERLEIEYLKKKLDEVQESFKVKGAKLVQTIERLRRRNNELTKKNLELQEEVRLLEQERAMVQGRRTPLAVHDVNAQTKKSTAEPKKPMVIHATANKSVTAKVKVAARQPSDRQHEVKAESDPVSSASNTEALNALQILLKLPAHIKETRLAEGKLERMYPDDTRLVAYRNGTTKEVSPAGVTTMRFANGDYRKDFLKDEIKMIYWHSEQRTLHKKLRNGTNIYEFSNGQVEKRYPDGSHEVVFPDKTVKYVYANGEERSFFPDGTVQVVDEQGERTVQYTDGTKEIYWDNFKKRVLADGTIKLVYPNGTQETRFPDGSVRFIDKNGNPMPVLN